MKRMFLKTAVCCGLAISLCTAGLPGQRFATATGFSLMAAQKGNGNGGAKPPSGRGGGGGAGGGSDHAQPPRGGNSGAGVSGRGGIHVPPISGTHGPGRNTGAPAGGIRTPTFTHPGLGSSHRVQIPAPKGNRPVPGGNIATGPPGRGPVAGVRIPGVERAQIPRGLGGGVVGNRQSHIASPNFGPNHVGVTNTGRNGIGGGHVGYGGHQSIIGNRPFGGNTMNLGNRSINIGHNNYLPSYYRHSGYHGYWNGNRGSNFGNSVASALVYGLGRNYGYGNAGYGGYGNYSGYGNGWGWGLGNGYGGNRRYRSYTGYGYRPIGWGLGGWGLGSLLYNSGYLGYSNPYYSNINSVGYNYSQPIQITYAAPAAPVNNAPNSQDEVLNNAVAAFQQNDFDSALDITNKGISQYPDDAVLHEFRSLVLFAKQDYQQSAATIHSVLAVGPGWDWTTLSGMYSSVDVYTQQLRSLEAFTKSNPQDAASQFLLAYHYMSCGHTEAATRHFQQVVRLMPNDRVAVELLRMLAPPEPGDLNPTTLDSAPRPQGEASGLDAKPVDPATLVGTWAATRDDGSVFRLILTNDAKFTWSFAQKGQAAQEFSGTYTVAENVLALERAEGGSLIAEVTPESAGKFNFRLLGAPDDDKGLEFVR